MFDDDTAILQAASDTVDDGRQTDADDVGCDDQSSTDVTVVRQLVVPDSDTQGPTSVTDAMHAHSSQRHGDKSPSEAVNAAPSDVTVAASGDNVVSSAVPRDTSSSLSKTQALKPSSDDIDDIFAGSSLFATCECFCVCIFYIILSTLHLSRH